MKQINLYLFSKLKHSNTKFSLSGILILAFCFLWSTLIFVSNKVSAQACQETAPNSGYCKDKKACNPPNGGSCTQLFHFNGITVYGTCECRKSKPSGKSSVSSNTRWITPGIINIPAPGNSVIITFNLDTGYQNSLSQVKFGACFGGNDSALITPIIGSITIAATRRSLINEQHLVDIRLISFSVQANSVDVPGLGPTGINYLSYDSLNGVCDINTGDVYLIGAGRIVNDLFPLNDPIKYFTAQVGEINFNFGELVMGAYAVSICPFALADSLAIYPRISSNLINTQHCVIGKVLDQNGLPVTGARVEFERTGANPGSGFALTDSNGTAQYCYVGNNAGIDTIEGSIFDVIDVVFKNWDEPLPVELSSFTSTINLRDVTINWTTATEENNSGFDIERSQNEVWNKIGFVQGHGTVSTSNNYSYEDRNISSGRYNYRLKQIDYNGNIKYYDLQNEVVIGIPGKFSLGQNYPNPFNPVTKINYDIPKDGKVTLKIFDINGREVKTIVNEFMSAGYRTAEFDGSNLPSGTYFYRIESGSYVNAKKMVLLK